MARHYQRSPLAKAQIELAHLEWSLADAEKWTDKDADDLSYIAGLIVEIEEQSQVVKRLSRKNAYQVGRPASRSEIAAIHATPHT